MAGSQISTSVSIIDSLSGFMALSLTEYNTSAAAAIAAGSKVEIAGAFFQFPSDETPTGWAAIVTATTAYIALTASGTAGSQVVNAGYVSTAPTWRDDLQGWYASAASSVRIVASIYKAEATRYVNKRVLDIKQAATTTEIYNQHGSQVFLSSGTFTVPWGVDTIYITGCAAGGNGGESGSPSGAGGGGGEWAIKKSFTVVAGSSYTVTIGTVGSNTSIGLFSLNCGSSASGLTAGNGGTLSYGTGAGGNGGTYETPGTAGFQPGGGTVSSGGGGGGGSYGSGGFGTNTVKGNNGGYGGGGGGSVTSAGGDPGTGGPAIIIVEW